MITFGNEKAENSGQTALRRSLPAFSHSWELLAIKSENVRASPVAVKPRPLGEVTRKAWRRGLINGGRKMKYKHIIWDFNGTVIDDVEIGIKSVNPLLRARGLKTIDSLAEYQSAFAFPIKEYYKNLGFDFNEEPYEKIAHEWVANYEAHESEIALVDGVRELICLFDAEGCEQMILSASESGMLERQLKGFGLENKFSKRLSLDNIYAHSKVDIAREYFETVSDRSAYLMIGDTEHDAEVARAVGIDAVLVACGHMSRERLKKTGFPVYDDMNGLKQDILLKMV